MEACHQDIPKYEPASNNSRFAKMAQQLGQKAAFEKDAFMGLGLLAKGVMGAGKFLSKAAPKGMIGDLGSKAVRGGKSLAGMSGRADKALSFGGKAQLLNPKNFMEQAYRSGARGLGKLDPRLGRGFAKTFRGVPGQAHGFGLFSGGLGAVTAEEGDRLGAFARGYGVGALGGLGWGAGRNLGRGIVSKSLQKTLSPAKFKQVMKTISPRFGKFKYTGSLGENAKARAMRIGMGTAGTAGALAGSELLMPTEGEESPESPYGAYGGEQRQFYRPSAHRSAGYGSSNQRGYY